MDFNRPFVVAATSLHALGNAAAAVPAAGRFVRDGFHEGLDAAPRTGTGGPPPSLPRAMRNAASARQPAPCATPRRTPSFSGSPAPPPPGMPRASREGGTAQDAPSVLVSPGTKAALREVGLPTGGACFDAIEALMPLAHRGSDRVCRQLEETVKAAIHGVTGKPFTAEDAGALKAEFASHAARSPAAAADFVKARTERLPRSKAQLEEMVLLAALTKDLPGGRARTDAIANIARALKADPVLSMEPKAGRVARNLQGMVKALPGAEHAHYANATTDLISPDDENAAGIMKADLAELHGKMRNMGSIDDDTKRNALEYVAKLGSLHEDMCVDPDPALLRAMKAVVSLAEPA